jgi:hypothetical protein
MKIVTMARNCGNIWMSSSASSPTRRPAKRMRLKAYAANIDSSRLANDATRAMNTELKNHRANG